jgi:SAM-dependent MidA family methyltransferase
LNAQLLDNIHKEISHKGIISFARYMELALYTPGLGYYSGGLKKFGKEGDFVTAPEISTLFAKCLARQIQQILSLIQNSDVLEFGAGSGKMAADLLIELEKLNCLPKNYYILELSANLKYRQRIFFEQKIPHLLKYIQWLDQLPVNTFRGVIVANEVLDAMPVHKFKLQKADSDCFNTLKEVYVTQKNGQFLWHDDDPSTPELKEKIANIANLLLLSCQEKGYNLPEEYISEINLFLPGWLNALNYSIDQAVVILLDYGYPDYEYYHPQRSNGTLTCHYQHRSHSDPLILTGLQDITAHVDFSLLAESAINNGFVISGYTDQAHFLLNCGLIDLLNTYHIPTKQSIAINQEIKLLTSPHEMGELIKVMALSKNIDASLLGFRNSDR